MKRTGFGLMTVGLAAALLLGGCATTKDLDAVRQEASKASASAASAQQTADAALREAQAARAAAERAEKAAMDAKAAADATNSKLDNMFKKSMQKG